MSTHEQRWTPRLLDVGRTLMTELDEEVVLHRALEAAAEATGARYAALGILNDSRTGLDRLITLGIDDAARAAIGTLPHGGGVLGLLIDDARPLRLPDISGHDSSYGFPAGHPVMRSFLGVPIMIRGQAWGNLYLANKHGRVEFTQEDEDAVVVLADWAAVAIENARLYETTERRRQELEKAVRGLAATRDVTIAIGSDLSLEHVLELIVKRGRALVGARSLVIMLRDGDELVVSAGAGDVEALHAVRVPIEESTFGKVLLDGRPERIADVSSRLRLTPRVLGLPEPRTALLVPLLCRGEGVGLLAAYDRGEHGAGFTQDDEQLLEIFAASAANAVAMAKSAHSEQLRSALAAADAERRRWGRELHDETLQGLGALRVLLSSALRRGDAAQVRGAAEEAVLQIEREIRNLRSIISELRPAALDELGLSAALQALVDHHRETSELTIELDLALPDPDAGDARLDAELEVSVYRLVQEALTNVIKHADASSVRVLACLAGEELLIEVSDDGNGFAPESDKASGFGLAGMRERARLAKGTLSIDSQPHEGTVVKARLSALRAQKARSAAGRDSPPGISDAPLPDATQQTQTPSRPRRSA